MGYEAWEAIHLSPASIDLDPRNPRLPGLPEGASQKQVSDEIFNAGKVREMIRSIARSGFFPDQRPVVVRKESGRGFIVIEGNRRVTACKALLDPDRVPEKHQRYARKWSVAAQPYKPSFEKIPVVVAPSRQAAMQLLASRHLNDAPVIGWSRYAQGRFAINALSEGQDIQEIVDETGLSESLLRECIQEARIFELFFGLSWVDDEREVIESDVDKFPIEALRRLLKSKVTHDAFGAVQFDDEGWISFAWEKDRIEPLLKRFVYDSMPALSGQEKARLTSRTLNDSKGVTAYINELPLELKPKPGTEFISGKALIPDAQDLSKKPLPIPPTGPARKPRPKVKTKPKLAALPDDIEFNLQNEKAQGLLEELQTIKPEDFPYASALLLRSLLEIALVSRMKKIGTWSGCVSKYQEGNTPPSLDKVLKFANTCDKTIADVQLRGALVNQGVVPRLLLNVVAHNDQHVFVPLEARDVANKLTPLLRYLLKGDSADS